MFLKFNQYFFNGLKAQISSVKHFQKLNEAVKLLAFHIFFYFSDINRVLL